MIVCYHRSSSLGTLEFCEQKYFLQYNLSLKDKTNKKAIWARAGELVPKERPGDFNQSLMELGATICLPRKPKCDPCPLACFCVAKEQGLQAVLPEKTPKKKPKPVTMHAVYAVDKERFLLVKRPSKGLLASMWELPCVEASGPLDDVFTDLLGIDVRVGPPMGEIVHVFSHRRQTTIIHPVRGDWDQLDVIQWYSAARWTSEGELKDMGLPKQTRKMLDVAQATECDR